ncbi:MsnO8 family LLM class oxidoreductase [Neobacillus mesonae]|nr:MsnO8 family LLM class oxidoreductase [Neobacillus mesonae]
MIEAKHIELGILDLVPNLMGSTAEEAIKESAELAIEGERLGYSRYWTSEHHHLKGIESASPEVLLSHIGARTRHMKLGSGAVLLPYHHPILVAERYNMLSALYPGRIELGIGRAPGGSAHLSMALAGNYLQKVVDYPESAKELQQLIQGDYSFDGETIIAKPMPAHSPSLWLLGTNVKSADYAASLGTGYVFGQFMSEQDGTEVINSYKAGFIPSKHMKIPQAFIAVSVICAPTTEEARSWKEEALVYQQQISGSLAASPEYPVIVGNPTEVADELVKLSERTDTRSILVVTRTASYEQRLTSYRLLAEAMNLCK